jgi:hypothetical protein
LNLNTILDILLNQRLGLGEYRLNYLYPDIHKNLKTNTLPIFSQYFPCYRRYTLNLDNNTTDIIDEFYINIREIKENKLQIISIASVTPKSDSINAGAYVDGYQPFAMSIEDVILNSVATDLESQSGFSFKRFRFVAPNRIKISGFGTQDLYVTFKIAYPSFSAIPDSVIEQFLNLAECDIKIFIYNKLKHYDQLALPIGNIDLKLNIFEAGEDQRKDIIEKFRTQGYPNKARAFYHRYE